MRLAGVPPGLFRRMFPRSNSRTNCARCRYRSCRVTKTTISEAVAAAGWPRQAPAARAINSGRVIWKRIPTTACWSCWEPGRPIPAVFRSFRVQRFHFLSNAARAPAVIQGFFQIHAIHRQLLLIKPSHDRFSHLFRTERVLARDQISVGHYFRYHRNQ